MNHLVAVLLVLLALVSTLGAGLDLDLTERPRREGTGGSLLRVIVVHAALLPLAAYALVSVLPLPADVRAALLLVALAPGGASAPLLARLAGGEGSRTAARYALLSVLSAILVGLGWPLLSPIGSPPASILVGVVLLQLAPMAVGVAMRARRPQWAVRAARPLRSLGNALLALTIGTLAIDRGALLANLGAVVVLAMSLLVVLCLASGAIDSPSHRGPNAVLASIRNLTLALVVAEAARPGSRISLVVAAYGLVMYGATGMVAWTLGRRNRIASPSSQETE